MTTTDTSPGRRTVRVVAWELTRRCELACRHCRGGAHDAAYAGELSTNECRAVIDSLATFGPITLILTGGEPMMRADLYELAALAHARGMRVVVAPCGPLVTPESARLLLDADVAGISLSLDGATDATHDAFRGMQGSFAAAVNACRCARDVGLPFQVNTTVTRLNVAELPAMLELAISLGARTLDFFFLVPVGRGANLSDIALDMREYERALHWVADAAASSTIRVKTTCAPQYTRIVRQNEAQGCEHTKEHTCEGTVGVMPAASGAAESPCVPSSHAPHPPPAGCMAGRGFLFISHTGILQPCGFLPVPCGDLRECAYDVHAACNVSTVLRNLADIDAFHGKCSVCEFRHVCGGCRARAYAAQGDYMGEEPLCPHVPHISLVALEDE